jgi:hypothetical protein
MEDIEQSHTTSQVGLDNDCFAAGNMVMAKFKGSLENHPEPSYSSTTTIDVLNTQFASLSHEQQSELKGRCAVEHGQISRGNPSMGSSHSQIGTTHSMNPSNPYYSLLEEPAPSLFPSPFWLFPVDMDVSSAFEEPPGQYERASSGLNPGWPACPNSQTVPPFETYSNIDALHPPLNPANELLVDLDLRGYH